MATALEHAAIGKIQGKPGDGVVQYLGVKYGHLQDRFAEAEMLTYSQRTTLDATRLAPMVLMPPDAVDIENGLVQVANATPLAFEERVVSDIDGLVLNITVPQSSTPSSKYPILAFIHGGGLNIGSTNWPIYDFSRLVRKSVAAGSPVIGIGINYRVGACGFLDSTELRAAGYKANRGFRDQKLALQWIKKYISGFGGDPDNITVGGESAGAGSVAYLLQQDEPLFKRAIMMSGSDILMKCRPQSDASYETACELLGVGDKSAEEKVKELVTHPALPMLGKFGMKVSTGATFDEDYIKYNNSLEGLLGAKERLPATKWLESLLIGDCTFDASVMGAFVPPGQPSSAARLIASAQKALGEDAGKLLSVYGVSDSTAEDEAFPATLRFMNDIAFHAPVPAYAQHFAQAGVPTNVYHFAALNPFPGRWQGEATHILDVLFLFQNYNGILSEQQRAIAESMADQFLAFVAGKKPWSEERSKCVYGPEEVQLVTGDLPVSSRERLAGFHALAREIGYDKLSAVFGAIMATQSSH